MRKSECELKQLAGRWSKNLLILFKFFQLGWLSCGYWPRFSLTFILNQIIAFFKNDRGDPNPVFFSKTINLGYRTAKINLKYLIQPYRLTRRVWIVSFQPIKKCIFTIKHCFSVNSASNTNGIFAVFVWSPAVWLIIRIIVIMLTYLVTPNISSLGRKEHYTFCNFNLQCMGGII